MVIGWDGRSGGVPPHQLERYFDGYLAELIVYNRALSPVAAQRVVDYLSSKYGIVMQ